MIEGQSRAMSLIGCVGGDSKAGLTSIRRSRSSPNQEKCHLNRRIGTDGVSCIFNSARCQLCQPVSDGTVWFVFGQLRLFTARDGGCTGYTKIHATT